MSIANVSNDMATKRDTWCNSAPKIVCDTSWKQKVRIIWITRQIWIIAECNTENILLESLLQISPRNMKLAIKSNIFLKVKINAIPVQTWTDPGGSRRLSYPDFKTIGT